MPASPPQDVARLRHTIGYTPRMTQIAVKLPDALVRELDDLVAQGVFPNRSLGVRRAIEAIVASQRREAVDRAFAQGYERRPESDAELAEARRLAEHAIHDEPWDTWW